MLFFQKMEKAKPSLWLTDRLNGNEDQAFDNDKLRSYLCHECSRSGTMRRAELFKKAVETDRVHVRLRGQFYNNINLGKRIFNATKKPVYMESIVGGMERRFEIMDSEVNHVVYQSSKSDDLKKKSRNDRIECNVSTMFKIDNKLFAEESLLGDNFWRNTVGCDLPFIHANLVDDPILFNKFIVTQAPMKETLYDFWKMVFQSKSKYIFMLMSRNDPGKCVDYYPTRINRSLNFGVLTVTCGDVDHTSEPFTRITRLQITHRNGEYFFMEHWQCDMNNSANLELPLRLLRLSRNCNTPTVVHDHYGISRAACLVAIEIGICKMMRGPTVQFPIQDAVQTLRKYRSFSVETPMQYIFIHRVVTYFLRPFIGQMLDFEEDYANWLQSRQKRLFIDNFNSPVPEYLQLCPTYDPDLLSKVNQEKRKNKKVFANSTIGYLPKSANKRPIVQFADC
uniref:Tyrosine-protein phosphatase domain-containing protein n=1 Tax=Rhabditophanes sp. KR3021 TaxID=114890 RepID=A0AC35TSB7_9BILA